MILLDTSGLLAALDASQSHHAEAAANLAAASPPLLLSPFVLAELDYLIASRVGQAARVRLLEEVQRGAYLLETMGGADVARALAVIKRHAALETMGGADVARALAVIKRHAALGISLADASIVVLAEHHGVREVLTLDERHFRVLTADGKPFQLLPADAQP